jgi:hypothetical protein
MKQVAYLSINYKSAGNAITPIVSEESATAIKKFLDKDPSAELLHTWLANHTFNVPAHEPDDFLQFVTLYNNKNQWLAEWTCFCHK